MSATSAGLTCERCDAPLDADQTWCVECGTATAPIRRAPDWRIGAAIVAAVVVLALAAFAIALISLGDNANRTAATSASTHTVTARSP